MNSQVKLLDFRGQKVFVGMDVHKKSWKVATCTMNTNPTNWPITIGKPFVKNLKKHLDKHYPNADFECGYEAGFCGFWIHNEMVKVGLKTKVAHASDIPTNDKERKQKEDKRDARKIAKALKNDDIDGIYVPTNEALRTRNLVRERYTITKSGRRIKCQIKSHLALYNIELPEEMTDKHWSRNYINWLERERDERGDGTLSLQLDRLEFLRKLQLKANKALRTLAKSEKYEELHSVLLRVPGIGTLTAMLLISEIIDMKRFSSFDNLCSYVGFIPTTNSSGDTDVKGHLTKRCNKRIKTALIESSWIAIKSDSALLLKYETFKKRMIGQKAIIRIARILLSRIRYIWLNQKRYEKGII